MYVAICKYRVEGFRLNLRRMPNKGFEEICETCDYIKFREKVYKIFSCEVADRIMDIAAIIYISNEDLGIERIYITDDTDLKKASLLKALSNSGEEDE